MGCNYAWDMSQLYDAGVSWTAAFPPEPAYCMNKGGGCCNAYNINNFKIEVDNLDACEMDTTATTILEMTNSALLWQIFPQPVRQNSVIYLKAYRFFTAVEIWDFYGNLLFEFPLSNGENSITLPETLCSGVYFVSAKTNESRTIMRKLIITN